MWRHVAALGLERGFGFYLSQLTMSGLGFSISRKWGLISTGSAHGNANLDAPPPDFNLDIIDQGDPNKYSQLARNTPPCFYPPPWHSRNTSMRISLSKTPRISILVTPSILLPETTRETSLMHMAEGTAPPLSQSTRSRLRYVSDVRDQRPSTNTAQGTDQDTAYRTIHDELSLDGTPLLK